MTNEISDIYVSSTGKYNFGTPSSPGVFLKGMGTSSGISVNGTFVMGDNYVNFGVSAGNGGYGLGVSSGGSIIVRNMGGDWTVITDIGSGGGSTAPAGSNTQVQFNNSETFGGVSNFTWNTSSNTLAVKDTISVLNTTTPFSFEKIILNSTGHGACIKLGNLGVGNPTITLNTVGNSSEAMITLEESTGTSVGLELGIEGSDFKGGIISMYETTQGISTLVISGGVSDSANSYSGSTIEMKRRKNDGTSIISPFTFDAPNLEMVLRNDNSGASVSFGMSASQTNATNFILPTSNGISGYVLETDGSGGTSWVPATGPAGSNNEIQFNNNNSFGASSGFTFDISNNKVKISDGTLTIDKEGAQTINIKSSDSNNNNEASINVKKQSGSGDNIRIVSSEVSSFGPAIQLYDETTTSLEKTVEIMGTADHDDATHLGGKIILTKLDSSAGPTTRDVFEIDGANQRILMRDYGNGFSIKFGVSTSITQNSNFFLPNGNGTNGYVLSTDGSGNTNWVAQSGGGSGSPSGPEKSVQFNSGSTFTGTSSLQFFEASLATGGVCALTVDGNVFSSMGGGVCDAFNSGGTGIYQLTTSEYVNGVVFLPYQAIGEEQFYQVRVPSATSVSADFSDVLKPGQFFDTILYGTSLGVSQTTLTIGSSVFNTTTYYPVDISVVGSQDSTTIFDTRLIRDRSGFTGQGLSFHFSELGLEYYQGVVIRSRYNSSNGISMYPISNSFYTF